MNRIIWRTRTTAAKMTRMMIIDDHPMVREGLEAMLSSTGAFEVVAVAANADEALAKMKEYPAYKKGDIVFDAEEDEVEDAPKEEEQ